MSFIPPLPGEISPAVDRAALSLAYGLTQDDAAYLSRRSHPPSKTSLEGVVRCG